MPRSRLYGQTVSQTSLDEEQGRKQKSGQGVSEKRQEVTETSPRVEKSSHIFRSPVSESSSEEEPLRKQKSDQDENPESSKNNEDSKTKRSCEEEQV